MILHREIKGEYEVGADVTMKRKRASEGEEPGKPKKIKVEEIAVEAPPENAATSGRENDGIFLYCTISPI